MIEAIVVLARRVLASPPGLAHAPPPLQRGRLLPEQVSEGEGSPGEGGGEFARLIRDRPHAGSRPGQSAHALLGDEEEGRTTRRDGEADDGGRAGLGPAPSLEVPMVSAGLASAAPSPPPPAPAATTQQRAASALQELWPVLVRRVAWTGDAHDGTMRLELGAGALSGATLLVRCEGSRVRVSLTDPAGGNLDGWRARIGARLLAAGLEVDTVE